MVLINYSRISVTNTIVESDYRSVIGSQSKVPASEKHPNSTAEVQSFQGVHTLICGSSVTRIQTHIETLQMVVVALVEMLEPLLLLFDVSVCLLHIVLLQSALQLLHCPICLRLGTPAIAAA